MTRRTSALFHLTWIYRSCRTIKKYSADLQVRNQQLFNNILRICERLNKLGLIFLFFLKRINYLLVCLRTFRFPPYALSYKMSTPRVINLYYAGNYSVYGFQIKLSRSLGPFILSVYLPSAMFVMMSWVSFLIPPVSLITAFWMFSSNLNLKILTLGSSSR